jgi:hypothetical protein
MTRNRYPKPLGDFTTTSRVIPLSVLAIGIGVVSTFVAWALLRLIGFFTNVFYYGRISTAFVSPAGHHLGWVALLIPVAGGLIIGSWPDTGPSGFEATAFPKRWSPS